VVALVLARLGLSLPLALPLGFSLALAAGCGYLAHREVLAKAERARRDFIRAFCTYVDLVALELTASGPVQALERAAKVCQGWAFDRITEALTQAQLEMTLPWQQLRRLAVQIGVPDLHDLAATMQSAGAEGAQVQQTLREQADSLRNRLRTEALARAEAISARLEMPAAMLVIVLAIFMIFPLMARLP
jgi:hypothetical protein